MAAPVCHASWAFFYRFALVLQLVSRQPALQAPQAATFQGVKNQVTHTDAVLVNIVNVVEDAGWLASGPIHMHTFVSNSLRSVSLSGRAVILRLADCLSWCRCIMTLWQPPLPSTPTPMATATAWCWMDM